MNLSVWKHLGVGYAGLASSHERGLKNHGQGESVLLPLGNFASALALQSWERVPDLEHKKPIW